MSAGKLITRAFLLARSQHQELARVWTQISWSVGSRLPASLLSISIQRDGETDILLRSMENEVAQDIANESKDEGLFGHYLNSMSTYWIGGMYEIFRLLNERKLADRDEAFQTIFRNLELLRIPLEKHEIAKDRMLDAPLKMFRYPPNDNAANTYTYAREDRQRAHIMPMGVSKRGSMTWQVVDLRNNATRWVERRWLADEIINLWRKKS